MRCHRSTRGQQLLRDDETGERVCAGATVLLRKRHADPAPLAHTAAELRIEPGQPAVATWHEGTGLELSGQEVADLIAQVGAPGRQRARVEQREFQGVTTDSSG